MSTLAIDQGRPADPLDGVRRALAQQVRGLVGGADGDAKFAAILLDDGPRWFADDRSIRLVHSDAAMFIGGLRALLLQSLHPLAMAGVAQHSNYRDDPWGRLQRTADFLTSTTFGTIERAEQAVAIVRRVHTRVNGTASDGRPYSANDPHLMAWVHAVEVDSFLTAFRRYGATTLDAQQADDYVADMARVASALGVTLPPTTVAELRGELAEFRPELAATAEARSAARYLLATPPLPLVARGPYAVLAGAAVALLPLWARVALRIPLGPISARLIAEPAGELITKALRWSLTAPA